MNHPDLSVIVLCYKAQEELISYTDAIFLELKKHPLSFEFVLVCNYDKGSSTPNKTWEIAKEVQSKYPNTKITFLEKAGGMGWDLLTGIDVCKCKYTCFLDGDGQTHPSDIFKLYEQILTGKYQLVKSYRKKRLDGFFRIVQSSIFNALFHLLYIRNRPRFKDVNAKPKMALTQTFHELNLESKDWFIDAEIIYKLYQKNAGILEIPTVFYENEHRQSFVNWKTILEFMKNMFQYLVKRPR